MRIWLALFLVILSASRAWAVPSFVAAASAAGGDVDGTITVSIDATGSDFMLACVGNGSGETSTAATFNGVSMTQAASHNNDDGNARSKLWQLVAPAAGTHNLVATFSDITNAFVGVMTFTGVHQTIPLGTPASYPSTSAEVEASVNVNSATDELAVDCLKFGNSVPPSISYGAGQTQRFVVNDVNSGSTKAGASTVTMTRTWDGSFQYFSYIGISIKPTGGGGGGAIRRRAVTVE